MFGFMSFGFIVCNYEAVLLAVVIGGLEDITHLALISCLRISQIAWIGAWIGETIFVLASSDLPYV